MEVHEKLESMNDAREDLEKAWIARMIQLNHCLDYCLELQSFYRDCEQDENWMSIRESFFASDHVDQREQVVALAIQRWTEFEQVAEDKDQSAPAAEAPTLASNRFHSVVCRLSAEEEAVILRVPPLAI